MSKQFVLFRKKYSPIIQKHFEHIEILPEVELVGEDIFIKRVKIKNTQIVELMLYKYKTILDTFVFGNSFIGNDYYLLRYASHELLLNWYVLSNEELSEDEVRTCKSEIETQFYFFINCVYNIKEKFETFANYKNGSILDSILIEPGKLSLENSYFQTYPHLEMYCKARGYVVHGTYAIKYVKETNKMYVSCFAFTLSECALEEVRQKKIGFDISPKEIVYAVKKIFELTVTVLDILKDLQYIDSSKLINKFKTMNNGKEAIIITF